MSGSAVAIERGAFDLAHATPLAAEHGSIPSILLSSLPSKRPRLFRQEMIAPNNRPRHDSPDAARPPSPEYGRDTGYVCDACRAVVWDPMLREQLPVWRFCPCCGSELMAPGAQTSYSDAAQDADATLEVKIEALASSRCEVSAQRGSMAMERRERSKRASAAHMIIPVQERVQNQPDRVLVQASARGTAMSSSIKAWLRKKPPMKPPIKRRQRLPYSKRTSASDLLHRLKEGKIVGQSRFCDVCGHKHPEVKCSECPSSFHKVCLNMQAIQKVSDDWTCHACHACKRKAIDEAKHFDDSSELMYIAETARTRWKPPDTPQQCSSCGYHETEAMNCDACSRWFCFACMCLSAATLPVNTWGCPECVGQDRYDEGRRVLIEVSRKRVKDEKVTAKEQDGFSQLVYDLSCTCNWDEWERNIDTLIQHAKKQLLKGEIPCVMPFHSLHYARNGRAGIDKMMIRHISEAYAKHAKEDAYKVARVKRLDGQGCEDFRMWKPERLKFAPNDQVCRLRIGYLSSDFVDHPTADLIQSALLKHDREKFEIFCYSISREDDSDYRRKLSTEMEHFTHFPKSHSDKKCADQISADGIHILVNLNGHTAGDRNGISALRPAPLQLVYLAYPGTMGADYIDYNVTDKVVCPNEHRKFYTERLLYMPHCYQVNSFRELYSDVLDSQKLPTRDDHQLPDKPTFIFCNFCRLGRITPDLFQVWMQILKRVPDSVIWLYKHPKAAVWRLQSQAEKAGVAPERLIFGSPCSPKLEHLKRVTLADLALDTLVYNGHTTASDMLWAGVPLITMRGDNWPSLVATCIAEAAEMGEMVVENLEAYEEKAVELATTPALLKKWKMKLAKKRKTAPLFDSGKWIRDFELSLDEIWRRYAEQDENPGDLIVTDVRPVVKRSKLKEDMVTGSPIKSRNGSIDSNANRPLEAADANNEPSRDTQPTDDSPKRKDGHKTAKVCQKLQLQSKNSAGFADHADHPPFQPQLTEVLPGVALKSADRKKSANPLSSSSSVHKKQRRMQKGKKQVGQDSFNVAASMLQPKTGMLHANCSRDDSVDSTQASVSDSNGAQGIMHCAHSQQCASGSLLLQEQEKRTEGPSWLAAPYQKDIVTQPAQSRDRLASYVPTPDLGPKRQQQHQQPRATPGSSEAANRHEGLNKQRLLQPNSQQPSGKHSMEQQAMPPGQGTGVESQSCAAAIQNSQSTSAKECNDSGVCISSTSVHLHSHNHGTGRGIMYVTPRIPKIVRKDSRDIQVIEVDVPADGVPAFPDPFAAFDHQLQMMRAHSGHTNNTHHTLHAQSFLGHAHRAAGGGYHDSGRGGSGQTGAFSQAKTASESVLGSMPTHRPASSQPTPNEEMDALALLASTAREFDEGLIPGQHGNTDHGHDSENRTTGTALSLEQVHSPFIDANRGHYHSYTAPSSQLPELPKHQFLQHAEHRRKEQIRKQQLEQRQQLEKQQLDAEQQLKLEKQLQKQLQQQQQSSQHDQHHVHYRQHDQQLRQHQHQRAGGAAVSTQLLQMPPNQVGANWAGRLADVLTSQAGLRFSSSQAQNELIQSQPGLFCIPPMQPQGAHQQHQQLLQLLQQQQHLVARESVGGMAMEVARREVLQEGLVQAGCDKDFWIETTKTTIKTMVRALCNDEFRMHYKRSSASDAVKTHLKMVATKAQNRLIQLVARLETGQGINQADVGKMQAGLRDLSEERAYFAVIQASQQLAPQFHWISQAPSPYQHRESASRQLQHTGQH